ncbi:MAG: nucleoside triphosphate pyrophosphohydrolase [Dehalococcoidales bacterium]|jgi:tetrapyrrole methylase family protein/MazG family protein
MRDYLEPFQELVGIIARLRAPDGCPWDRKQTHESLREGLMEECYEVLAAIDEQDMLKLKEELGDLLLHVIFQAQIAAEDGDFTLAGVLDGINRKLTSRHPHVFASGEAQDADQVAVKWEELKREERGQDASVLASVPRQMPALAYSQSVQGRVARLGFDWENVGGVIEKLAEEVSEFQNAADQEQREAEFGDMLFTLVNVGRRLGISSETALREANRRFYRRFTRMEELCRERGLSFGGLSFEEQNALWDEAKRGVI